MVRLQFWSSGERGAWSTHLISLLPDPLWPGGVEAAIVQSIGQIDQLNNYS